MRLVSARPGNTPTQTKHAILMDRMWVQTGWMTRLGILVFILLWAGGLFAASARAQHIRLQEAVRIALAENPAMLAQQEVLRAQEGEWQATLGQFDPQITFSLTGSRDHDPYLQTSGEFANSTIDATTYSVGVTKQFRFGMAVTPTLQMTRQNSLGDGRALNDAQVGLRLFMPLMQGRGIMANAVDERVGYYAYDAGRKEYQHTRAEVVRQAVAGYWSYLAAWQRVVVYRESEARAQTLREETNVLIEAEEQPAVELDQLQANVAAKTAQRIAAEQSLYAAEQQLGLILGLAFEQMRTLGEPADGFPRVDDGLLEQIGASEPFIALALERRGDLAGARIREQATRILLHAVRNTQKARLDLTVDLGYAGVDAGLAVQNYLTPFGRNVGGLNAGVRLSYSLPVRNQRAQGQTAQQASNHHQQIIRTRDLSRAIQSRVLVALKALERSIYELRSAEAAMTLYQAAVVNEKKKFQVGLATLIDVINVQDRLTEAMLGHIASQQRYAEALVQVRYETGTLIDPHEQVLDLQRFITVPVADLP